MGLPAPHSLMPEKFKNILIAVNTYDGHQYCRAGFVKNLEAIQQHSGSDVVIFYNGQKEPWGFEKWPKIHYQQRPDETGLEILTAKNNLMREYCLKNNYAYMFMLESDIIPPIDIITRLHSHHKDVVTAIYFIKTLLKDMVKMPNETKWKIYDPKTNNWDLKTFPAGSEILIVAQKIIPSIWLFKDGVSRLSEINDILPQKGLIRIFSAGIGAVLIKNRVLETCGLFQMQEVLTQEKNFTDFIYFKKIHNCGFQAFADTNIICRHDHYDFDDLVVRRWFNIDTMETVNGTPGN